MTEGDKPAGRPPRHKGERLSKNRTFRVRGELDEKLQHAAEASGRSVSEEIEFRLEQSFAAEEKSRELKQVFARLTETAASIQSNFTRLMQREDEIAAGVKKLGENLGITKKEKEEGK